MPDLPRPIGLSQLDRHRLDLELIIRSCNFEGSVTCRRVAAMAQLMLNAIAADVHEGAGPNLSDLIGAVEYDTFEDQVDGYLDPRLSGDGAVLSVVYTPFEGVGTTERYRVTRLPDGPTQTPLAP